MTSAEIARKAVAEAGATDATMQGLAYNASRDVLYVASTADNAIYAVRGAGRTRTDLGKGTVIFSDPTHLHGPLGLVQAPNGDLIAANGDAINADPNQPSELVEFTPSGRFLAQFQLQAMPDAPFGIALLPAGRRSLFAAVNDDTNSLEVWAVRT